MLRIFIILILTNLLINKATGEEFSFEKHTSHTINDTFDTQGFWILAVGTGLTVIAHQYDQEIHDRWKNNQQMPRSISLIGDFWGTGIPEVLITTGQIYLDPQNGIPAFEGLVWGGLITHGAKYLIGRERPDSDTKTSMPSGHTQAAFSIASSMTESYGWKKSLPYWGLAVLTGASRLADNAHWFSDVTAGATIGILCGRAGFAHHKNIQPLVLFNDGKFDGAYINFNSEW